MSDNFRQVYEFTDFRLDAEQPSLWHKGELVSVPPKALQILVLLVEKRGEIVSRKELLENVWHETFVEEANINYTISLLRKSLGGAKFIQTVPKSGYRFTAEVEKIKEITTSELTDSKAEIAELEDVNNESDLPPTIGRKRWWTIASVVTVTLVLALGSGYFIWQNNYGRIASTSKRKIKTLAVLPFSNLDKTVTDNSISFGLSDSLISRLGSLGRITIRPFGAVEKFSNGKSDPIAFGKELNCDAVLVGAFETVENRLRLTARLLDVRDGTQIWRADFDETETNLFLLQNKLAKLLAASLIDELSQPEQDLLEKRYTGNLEAYKAYLRGRTIFERRIENGYQQVLDEYQFAISRDPAFALPYAGLADLFSRRGNGLGGAEAAKAYKEARFYAQKALELDADLAEAHTSLGRIKRTADWDWDGAESEFKKAIELDPNSAIALAWYAQMLSFRGKHDDALKMINRAIEIDPISPAVNGVLFPVLEGRGEFDEGLRRAKAAYLFNKENPNARRSYATFLYHKGRFDEVISIVEESTAKKKIADHAGISLLASSYHKTGQALKAAEALERLKEASLRNTKYLYSLSINFAELGQFDKAIEALEKCYELREERIVWMNNEPRFGSLRSDPRFQDLVVRLRLTS